METDEQVKQLAMDFSLSIDHYGEEKTVELIPNGANIALDLNNKELYISSYLKWYFETSIEK
jgi:hypothetical protein